MKKQFISLLCAAGMMLTSVPAFEVSRRGRRIHLLLVKMHAYLKVGKRKDGH